MNSPLGLEIGSHSEIGDRKENQDRLLVTHPDDGSLLVGIFDGHGPNGAKAAEYAMRTFEHNKDRIPRDLTGPFERLSKAMGANGWEGGTTATVVRVMETQQDGELGRLIITNNVGDSPALLIDPYAPDGPYGVITLTQSHNGNNATEVRRMGEPGNSAYDRDSGVFIARDALIYLAMSRALGDANIPGVISEPHVSGYFSRAERVLVAASDGIITDDNRHEVIDLFSNLFRKRRSMGEIATSLTYEFSKQTHDNATAVVVHMPSMR